MEGSKYSKKTAWTALASAVILGFAATEVRAELIHAIVAPEATIAPAGALVPNSTIVCFVPQGLPAQPTASQAREDWHAVAQGMRSEWEAIKRETLETAVTLFFIRGGTPPSTPPPSGGNAPPPGQSNTPPGGNGTPPPPGGNGETPPGDPGSPPTGTPEPASLVMALLGAGIAIGSGWRRRVKRG